MNRETALGMLRVGNTGNEILQILDVIESDMKSDNQGDAVSYTTGETVTFWLLLSSRGVLDSLPDMCYSIRVR